MRRRKVLASAGALIGTGFANGVVGKEAENSGMSLKEAGLKGEYHSLMKQGKFDEAESLLESGNVKYGSGSKTVRASRGSHSNEDGVSTEVWFDQGESDVGAQLTLEDSSEDIYEAWGYITYSGSSDGFPDYDAELAQDGAAITFNSDLWRAEEASQDGVEYIDEYACHDWNHEEYNINEGVAASVDIGWISSRGEEECKDVGISMKTLIERTEEEAEDIQFEYEHTGAVLSGSVSVGLCYGALCVDTGIDTKTLWQEEVTASI